MSTPTCRYCDAEKTFHSVVRGYNIINIPSCFIMSFHIKLVLNRLCKGLILSHYRYHRNQCVFSNLCNVLISIISWLYGNLVLFISFDKTRQDWRGKHRVSMIPLLSTQTNKVSNTDSAVWAKDRFMHPVGRNINFVINQIILIFLIKLLKWLVIWFRMAECLTWFITISLQDILKHM